MKNVFINFAKGFALISTLAAAAEALGGDLGASKALMKQKTEVARLVEVCSRTPLSKIKAEEFFSNWQFEHKDGIEALDKDFASLNDSQKSKLAIQVVKDAERKYKYLENLTENELGNKCLSLLK